MKIELDQEALNLIAQGLQAIHQRVDAVSRSIGAQVQAHNAANEAKPVQDGETGPVAGRQE
jgi:hypothetical protein